MSEYKKQVGIAVTIALVGALALATFASLSFPSQSGPPTSSSTSSENGGPVAGYLPTVSGSILANSSTGAGVVSLQVRDILEYPFTAISVIGVSPLLPDIIDNVTLSYNGTPVSESNPLPTGQIASGIAGFGSGAAVGSNHTVDVAITMANGQGFTATTSLSVGVLTTGTSPTYVANGTLVIPNGTGNGTLTVQVRNNDINNDVPNNPSLNTFYITAVIFTTLTLPTGTGAVNATTTHVIANISDLVMTYHGSPVSSTNPVPPGASATGSINVTGVTAGVGYQVNITIHFSNDESAFDALSITAQL